MQSHEFSQYKFVKPKSFTTGRKAYQPTVIIIHATEGSEGRASAEDGAAYDAKRTDGTSTHFFVDQDSTVQCVNTYDEAHAARTHGNDVGIQIEICGKATQSVTQWIDLASIGAVNQAAHVCVALRRKYGKNRFPLIHLTPSQLRNGENGFAGHKDVTLAWPEDHGDHTDPGPNFPWVYLFSTIRSIEATNDGRGTVTAMPTWSDSNVLALNFWFQEASRAATGNAGGPTNADVNARHARDYLYNVLNNDADLNALQTDVNAANATLSAIRSTTDQLLQDVAGEGASQVQAGIGDAVWAHTPRSLT